jgi:hypothetical protein
MREEENAHVEVPPVLANRAIAVHNRHRIDVRVLKLVADLLAVAAARVDLDFCVLGPGKR